MKLDVGILLDPSVTINYCLFSDNRNCVTYDFLSYLEDHRELGIVTREIKENTLKVIKKLARKAGAGYSTTMEKFKRIETFLKTENISNYKNLENFRKTRKMIGEIVAENRDRNLIRPWTIPNRYRPFANEFYLQQVEREVDESNKDILRKKIFCQPIEIEDLMVIATAVTLKEKKYNEMYLASLDKHHTDELVSSSIKDEFGIICDDPRKLLPKLKGK